MPAFYLPKEIVDSMGLERLARVAHNYANEIQTDVTIAYDPAFSLFKVAPPEYMASNEALIYLDTVVYQHGTIIPLRKWELMIPNSSDRASNFGKASLVEVGPGNRKITKPPNCFILFRRDKRHLVQERYPDATLGQISSIVAQMWAAAPKKEKLQYHSKALELKRQHDNVYPDWKCQPRKSSDIKKRAVKKCTPASSPILVSMVNSASIS
nr:MAT1-1-3 [Pseudogymnoascus sp. 23342-1-I1]